MVFVPGCGATTFSLIIPQSAKIFVLGAMGVEGGVARLGDNDFEVTFEAFNQFGPILVEAVSLTALLVDVRPGKPC